MSLELTKNKSNIGSGALNDLVFILYCCVIGQWLLTRRRSVDNQSAISWGAIGNRLAIGRRLVGGCILSVCFWLQKVCNFLEIGRQPIGDWSAISRQLKTVSGLSATVATGRWSVGNQSATCRQPVGDHQKPFYDRFGRREVSLAATKTSLRPNRPCNRLQPVGDQSPTSLQPPCNLPATTLNFGRKEVADQLQAMCDRGLREYWWLEWSDSGVDIKTHNVGNGIMRYQLLTHWGRVTHICVSKLTIIGSDNGSAPGQRQAIIWTNAGMLLIGPLRTNFSEIFIEIYIFSFKKMLLKMSSGICRPFCLCLNVLSTDILSWLKCWKLTAEPKWTQPRKQYDRPTLHSLDM